MELRSSLVWRSSGLASPPLWSCSVALPFSSFPSPAAALAAASDYSDVGPAFNLGEATVYPAIRIHSWFHSAELLCRVAESDLWVSSWDCDGLTTHGAVTELGRPLESIVRELAATGTRIEWLEVFEDHETPEWISLREMRETQGTF